MLLLTRRPGEQIIVIDQDTGEELVIAVLPHQKPGNGIGIEEGLRFQIHRC